MKKLIALLFVLMLFAGCKKKKNDSSETPVPYSPPASTSLPPNLLISIPLDADGVLNASRIPATFSNSFTTKVGNASAFFYTAAGNYNYVDAGTVKCNDSTLVKLSGGSYSFSGKAINGQTESGIKYSSGSFWAVGGTSGVPSFTLSHGTFPTDAVLTSANTFTHNAAYNVTYSGVTNADSVVILFGCDSSLLKKTVVASAGSCSFTASEVASVQKKNSVEKGYFNFMAYKLISATFSGKKYYFVNSATSTYTVTIQ